MKDGKTVADLAGADVDERSDQGLGVQMTELFSEAIQLRLLFCALRKYLPEESLTDYLAVEQAVVGLEIRLGKLSLKHQIAAAEIHNQTAQTIH